MCPCASMIWRAVCYVSQSMEGYDLHDMQCKCRASVQRVIYYFLFQSFSSSGCDNMECQLPADLLSCWGQKIPPFGVDAFAPLLHPLALIRLEFGSGTEAASCLDYLCSAWDRQLGKVRQYRFSAEVQTFIKSCGWYQKIKQQSRKYYVLILVFDIFCQVNAFHFLKFL